MIVRYCIYCDAEALPDGETCADCKRREETLTVDLDEEEKEDGREREIHD